VAEQQFGVNKRL